MNGRTKCCEGLRNGVERNYVKLGVQMNEALWFVYMRARVLVAHGACFIVSRKSCCSKCEILVNGSAIPSCLYKLKSRPAYHTANGGSLCGVWWRFENNIYLFNNCNCVKSWGNMLSVMDFWTVLPRRVCKCDGRTVAVRGTGFPLSSGTQLVLKTSSTCMTQDCDKLVAGRRCNVSFL